MSAVLVQVYRGLITGLWICLQSPGTAHNNAAGDRLTVERVPVSLHTSNLSEHGVEMMPFDRADAGSHLLRYPEGGLNKIVSVAPRHGPAKLTITIQKFTRQCW